MTQLGKDLQYFWSSKIFAAGLTLIMVLSYATLIFHPTVGIDDTAFKVYFIDGVSPNTGRWCIYLLNKLFPLSYNPYFVEALGLLVFCLSVSLWCVVFYRLFGDRLSVGVYTVFAGVMISSPIISELVVWYLQNGMYMAFGVTALAVLSVMEVLREQDRLTEVAQEKRGKKTVAGILSSAVLLTIAMGFYESFMIVFVVGILLVFMVVRALDTSYSRKISLWLICVGGVGVLAMILRSLAIKSVVAIFKLENQANVLDTRNLSDIFAGLFGWLHSPEEGEKLLGIVREYFVKYFCNAVVYLPILILVLAVGVIGLWVLLKTIQKKDGWIFATVVGIIVLPVIMSMAEGVATHYRAAQYIPLLTAFAVFPIAWEGQRLMVQSGDDSKGEEGQNRITSKKRRTIWVRTMGCFLAFVLLYQQAYEMNKWLYIDAQKYEDSKRTMDAVAFRILENCDSSKPVCIIGSYQSPVSLIEEAYTPSWSRRYTLIRSLVCLVDEELFEKYNTPYGYAAAETPLLSTINWGATAFYGFDRELIKFWKMHGFTFVEDGNLAHYEEAKRLMQDAPVWPQAGSVVETDEYIIVNFGNYSEMQ